MSGKNGSDTSMVALTRTINEIGKAFEAFKETNDERLEALKNGDGSRAAELNDKLGRIEKDVSQFSALRTQIEREQELHRERIEELEARASTPGKTLQDKQHDEYRSTFVDWVRNRGNSSALEQQMQELRRRMREVRADVTIGTDSAGGHAVPEEIAREIKRLELLFSPVRGLVKVVRAGTNDYKELVSLRGATSGWVGETTSRPATVTPTLREVAPTMGELYAYPQASEWSLDDIFFNVEAWLAEEVAQEFALQEGQAVIDGDGTNKPTGMTNTAPVATADFASPLRAAAAYELVDSDTALSPAAPGILADSLFDLVYRLRTPYRARATWTYNSATAGAIRRLKDSNGQYHWQPGLQQGQPDRLLGYPTVVWEQMDDIGAGLFPVFFGDFRRAYVLVDRVGLRITRDNITNIGFVRFYIRRREGGIVLNNDALKVLRTV